MINNEEFVDEIGDNHISLSAKNPVREDAFNITDDEKIEKINFNFPAYLPLQHVESFGKRADHAAITHSQTGALC